MSNRDELESWADRLAAAGIVHSPPAPANSIPEGFVLVFRDPDNIQLELVAEGEPADPASP